MFRVLLLILLMLPTFFVAHAKESVEVAIAATAPMADLQTHEQLQAALWVRTAVEYQVACVQAYELAGMRLPAALADASWTAATEQTDGYQDLPPAVVLDVDETVLDNSKFQVRLIAQKREFSSSRWNDWVNEEKATAVPGVKQFIQLAQKHKVAIIFLTNRDAAVEAATVRNLSAELGMPVTAEAVHCKGEQPDWTSGKTARRRHVAQTHRILLLIGDDFNDFVLLDQLSPEYRTQQGKQYQPNWGKKWIQLPNPVYGHWERAIYDYDFSLSQQQKLRRKYETLGDGDPPTK